MRRLILVFLMSAVAAPAAAVQGSEVRSDARIYLNAEQRLQRAEEEATCAWYPVILHRIIDMRTVLRRLERFADRNGEVTQLQAAARHAGERGLCFGVSSRMIETWLAEARRDMELLGRRLRRSRWQDPNMWRPDS